VEHNSAERAAADKTAVADSVGIAAAVAVGIAAAGVEVAAAVRTVAGECMRCSATATATAHWEEHSERPREEAAAEVQAGRRRLGPHPQFPPRSPLQPASCPPLAPS
jgi:hypothetical protein